MTVLRTYLALLRKQWLIAFSYAAIFLILAFIIGVSGQPADPGQFETEKISLALSQAAGDERGRRLASWFERDGQEVFLVDLSEEEAREAIFVQDYQAIFLFDGEGQTVKALVDEGSAGGFLVLSGADNYFRYLASFRNPDGSYDFEKLESVLDQTLPVEIQAVKEGGGGNSDLLTAFLSSLAYILLLMTTTLIPLINQTFTETAVRARSSLSPYPVRSRTLEMLIGSGLIVFGAASLLLAATLPVTHSLFEAGQTGKILANYALFSLAVLGLSYALSVILRSRVAVTAVSTVLSLGMAFLSGAFVPQPLLNETALGLARIFPLYYFIHANRFSASWAEMAPDLVILAGFACLYFLLAAAATWYGKRSRRQLSI